MEKAIGIIIRRQPLSETSEIIGWSTEEHGLIKTVAKGSRSAKSAFAGKLDLFFGAEFEFVRSRRSDLHTLKEIRLMAWRPTLHSSYRRVLAASYFIQLIESVVEKETPLPEFHDLLLRSLGWLEKQEPDMRGVTHFETEVARLLGLHTPDRGAAANMIRELTHSLPDSRGRLLAVLGA